ncbi:MAG: nitrate/nitrite transporter NrtS [Burkholderiaceae bacterium]
MLDHLPLDQIDKVMTSFRWLSTANDKALWLRAIKTACVVGCVLAVINHGPELFEGTLEPNRGWRMLLTFFVPFTVAMVVGVTTKRNAQLQHAQALASIQREIERNKRLPEANPSPVLRVSKDGLLEYANPASEALCAGLRTRAGQNFPSALLDRLLTNVGGSAAEMIEVEAGSRTYALRASDSDGTNSINVYGLDVTANKVMSKLPAQNPNPVMQVASSGELLYVNPAAEPIVRHLGLAVGMPLNETLLQVVTEAAHASAAPHIELKCGEQTYEIKVAPVPEFESLNLYGTDVTANRQLAQAYEENERLLLNILPNDIAHRLKSGESVIADELPDVSILFADIVGFTEWSSKLSAAELVALLNGLFREFDALAVQFDVEKIKTIGDCYMAVAGLSAGDTTHGPRLADLALAMLEVSERFADETGHDLRMRFGLHSGAAVAGVMGHTKFIFDVWGDAVNTASRMESHGQPGAIHVSDEFARRVSATHQLEPRGVNVIKGKGSLETFFLRGALQ